MLVSVSTCARLDNTYLPPAGASQAGGGAGLGTPSFGGGENYFIIKEKNYRNHKNECLKMFNLICKFCKKILYNLRLFLIFVHRSYNEFI